MLERPNEQNHRTDRHRHWLPLRAAALLVLAVALIVDVVVVDTSQVGFLVPVLVAVAIAVFYDNRGNACGRRHAK
jgi:hypothetical protein